MTTNITYEEQVTQEWNAQGHYPHDMELWEMLCGYLDIHGGRAYIGLLPTVLHPLMITEQRALAVRQWFAEQQALPVEEWDGARVALLPDWRERLERMQDLAWDALASVEYWIYGFLPWYWHLDFAEPETNHAQEDN